MHTFDSNRRPCSLILTRANYAPKLSSLLSVHALLQQKCSAVFRPCRSHIELPDGRRVMCRRQGNKDFLDSLVPA